MSNKNFNTKVDNPVRSGKVENPVGTLYIGVDIAKHKHFAAALDERGNNKSKAFGFSNRRKGFEEFYRQISRWLRQYNCDLIEIAMEPTASYWEPLFGWLAGKGFTVKLVSSLAVRRIKDVKDNSPLKSDKKDALIIGDLCRQGITLDFRVAKKDFEELKKLVLMIDDLNKDAGVWANRLEQFLARSFPELMDLFKDRTAPGFRAILRRYPFPADLLAADFDEIVRVLKEATRGQLGSEKAKEMLEAARGTVGLPCGLDAERLSVESYLNMLDKAVSEKKRLESALEEKAELLPLFQTLKSIEGLGLMGASAIIGFLGDLKEYGSADQVMKKAGLNLFNCSSGQKSGKDRITKRGRSVLRHYLYMPALYHTQEGRTFNDLYRRVADGGKGRNKAAIVAVMRKLLKVAYALVRDDRIFERNYDAQGNRCANARDRQAARDVTVILRAEAV